MDRTAGDLARSTLGWPVRAEGFQRPGRDLLRLLPPDKVALAEPLDLKRLSEAKRNGG
jgi:hypothetical protein